MINKHRYCGPLTDPLALTALLRSFADHLGVRRPQVEDHWPTH